ncbi:xin actin-binding repeat-containing protein 1 isoform X2 [Fundulus heteroclitus]|nr:xin actin-binding repeat-containing protein 1 isoform X2 [Fundulus heteroclitus]XP_035980746.1 xin actin-binding repeat-containing protein 1 isoform X2 [Fundulus heteroclitus]
MSALYMSKVANRESTNTPTKVRKEQAQPQESGKRVKLTKMSDHSQQRKDDLQPQPPEEHHTGPEDISEAHSDQLTSRQLSREMLFQQRQKNELRRLLKHTCPELKMLDDVVAEEFAEVLSSEIDSGGETGYEGEVLSRCLVFENRGRSNNTPKINMAEGAVERRDYRKTSAVFEGLKEEPDTKSFKGMTKCDKSPDLTSEHNKDVAEEVVKIDVKATRKVFENQSSITYKPDDIQRNVPMVLNKEKIVGKIIKQSEISSADNTEGDNRSRNRDSEEKSLCLNTVGQSNENGITCSKEYASNDPPLVEGSMSFLDFEGKSEMLNTNADLFKNNPFISTNIEKENSYSHASKTQNQSSAVAEDYPTANVKTRAHLFESMPFDKIRHQNQDEIETLVENIKETLHFLHHVKAIHSEGVIIEVNETMNAKKSKFTLSDMGPEIKHDEVAEGGAQNFIVQLLPRINLKPQITYLKEDSKGLIEATVMDALAHQHQFSSNKDVELKTANVVQLVEDILNQDNSLRKGVIIQEDARKCAEVIVYSLYKYFDEDDVKSYVSPKSAEHDESETNTGSTSRSCQDQSWSRSIRANVKLFKSCIEKGDLEYLRSLHDDEPTIQNSELSQNKAPFRQDDESHHQEISDPAEEYIQVDVKTLKGMFSDEKSPSHGKHFKSSAVAFGKSQFPIECNTGVFLLPQPNNSSNACFGHNPKEIVVNCDGQDDNRVHQVEMAELPDGTSDSKDDIHNFSQAETEAKCGLFQEIHTEEFSEIPNANVKADIVTFSRKEAQLPQENRNPKEESCLDKFSKTPFPKEIISGLDSDWQHKNPEMAYQDTTSTKLKTAETCKNLSEDSTELVKKENSQITIDCAQSSEETPAQKEGEVCYQGSIQAALDSLEKSNINVTRGDFRAAMIYRHSYKSNQKTSQSDVQKSSNTDLRFMAEPEANQQQPKQEVTVVISEPPNPIEEPLNLEVAVAMVEPPNPTKEPLNLEVTVANAEPPHPTKEPLNLEATVVKVEPPRATEPQINQEVTVANAEHPHPTKEPLNLEVTVANVEPPQPTKEPLNLEVTVANAELPHPTKIPLNLEVTVANAEPPQPTKEPLNLEVTVANVELPHITKEPLNLEVTVANAEPPQPTKEPLNLEVTVANAELPHPTKIPLNLEVTVANAEPPQPTKEPLNQDVTVANAESPQPTKETLNLEVTVANAELPHSTKEPINQEVTVATAESPHLTKKPINQVSVPNAESPHLTKEPINLEVTVANAESPNPVKQLLNQEVTVANPNPTKETLNLKVAVANDQSTYPLKHHCRPTQGGASKNSKRVSGPKPSIPPKPEHLKGKHLVNHPSATRQSERHNISTVEPKESLCQVPQPSATTLVLSQEESTIRPVNHHGNDHSGEATEMLPHIKGKSEVQCLTILLENNETDIKNINVKSQIETLVKDKNPQNLNRK